MLGDLEILVADGMSDDGTRELLLQLRQDDSRIIVIDNPRRIVSVGLNLAIRSARADIVVRMDAHTEYAPDYIKNCVDVLMKTGADNVGGPAGTKAETYLQQAIAAAYHSSFAVGGAKFHMLEYEGPVDTVTYGCWRRETFERFGYFDELLVRNQDDEHNLRISRGGGKIWQSPAIRSWYHPRSSLAALFNQYLQYGYWKVRVIQKHRIPASWRHLVPAAFLLTLSILMFASALGFLVSRFWSPALILSRWAGWLLFGVLGLYVVCLLAASARTAAKTKYKLLPVLPVVFCCYHFSYGFGFLKGIADFVVRRKAATNALTRITRSSEAKI
jgi:glycosyltransferase involved in cell wall biosynthesis